MALKNLAAWSGKKAEITSSACGTACGSGEKAKAVSCGTACGSGDKPSATACGSACGSGDK